VLLDQFVLEKERLLHVACHEDVDRSRALHERRNPDPPVATAHVLADATLQILRLADVEHAAACALEEIDPGPGRQFFDLFFE
jgi:hypothetical protein